MIKTVSAIATVLLGAAASPAVARDTDFGALHITHPWVRAAPSAAPTAAGYLTVTNRGRTPERLLGGASPLFGAVEAHSMTMDGGVMRMRLLPQGFEIAPGATLALSPAGGGHLMLVGPKRPLKVGDRVPVTLKFAHAGAVAVVFAVESGSPAAGTMSGMSMN